GGIVAGGALYLIASGKPGFEVGPAVGSSGHLRDLPVPGWVHGSSSLGPPLSTASPPSPRNTRANRCPGKVAGAKMTPFLQREVPLRVHQVNFPRHSVRNSVQIERVTVFVAAPDGQRRGTRIFMHSDRRRKNQS